VRCARAQEILEIEQLMDEQMGLELTEDNLETVLDEIRPYLVGAAPLVHAPGRALWYTSKPGLPTGAEWRGA
jgi:hypothetical protein